MSHSASDSQSAIPDSAVKYSSHRFGDPVVLTLTMGFIALFVGLSIYDTALLTSVIGEGFAWTAKYLGSFFQMLLLATFVISIGIAFSRAGQAKIGILLKSAPSVGYRW